jgi:hypothetical protein
MVRRSFVSLVIAMGYFQLAQGQQQSGLLKIAAVQIRGYDK